MVFGTTYVDLNYTTYLRQEKVSSVFCISKLRQCLYVKENLIIGVCIKGHKHCSNKILLYLYHTHKVWSLR